MPLLAATRWWTAFTGDPRAAVFLVSLKAGGTGLNLTAASYVVLFDPWWNPAVEAQAIDRTHRIGQDRTVIAYRMLATRHDRGEDLGAAAAQGGADHGRARRGRVRPRAEPRGPRLPLGRGVGVVAGPHGKIVRDSARDAATTNAGLRPAGRGRKGVPTRCLKRNTSCAENSRCMNEPASLLPRLLGNVIDECSGIAYRGLLGHAPDLLLKRLGAATPRRRLDFYPGAPLVRTKDGFPGAILECGTHHGATLLGMAHILRSRGISARLYGLDSFEGFPEPTAEDAQGDGTMHPWVRRGFSARRRWSD